VRVGVDLLYISRFKRIAEHQRYRRALFTARELDAAADLRQPRLNEYLAGRFCAKEAVAKLLGHGFGQGLGWRDIEIVADELGAPAVTLHNGAARLAAAVGLRSVNVSLSHQEGLVICIASGCCRAKETKGCQ
jgi:holo-[acyl-carrier protein] synthase